MCGTYWELGDEDWDPVAMGTIWASYPVDAIILQLGTEPGSGNLYSKIHGGIDYVLNGYPLETDYVNLSLDEAPFRSVYATFSIGGYGAEYKHYVLDRVSMFFLWAEEDTSWDRYALVDGSIYEPVSSVPLPATAWLMLGALGGLGMTRRRRTRPSGVPGPGTA